MSDKYSSDTHRARYELQYVNIQKVKLKNTHGKICSNHFSCQRRQYKE